MHELLILLMLLSPSFLPVIDCEENINSTKHTPEVPPVIASVLINPESRTSMSDKEFEIKNQPKCNHTDYRSYVECLLAKSKREKRQNYQQCPGGSSCNSGIFDQRICTGSGCHFGNQQQQQQCVGNGCVQPCLGNGCSVYVGYNCENTGCNQVNKNCNGVVCNPPCNAPSPCPQPQPQPEPRQPNDLFRREIAKINEELGQVKAQNEKLIRSTEKATSFILQLLNRHDQPQKFNPTTNIDISNYLNNTNVVNVPDGAKTEVVEKKNCCTVIRPTTCRKTRKPPYFFCGQRRHRSCGSHCEKGRVLYSRVKPGCTKERDDSCVTYHTRPHDQSYEGYPTSGYHPPTPMYYSPLMPIYYAPPQTPIYSPHPMYLGDDDADDVIEDCEGCDSEGETEDCEDADNDSTATRRGDRPIESRRHRSTSLAEIIEVKEETDAIKRSEDQLTASIDMLQEAIELKKLEENKEEMGKISSGTTDKSISKNS